MSEHKVETQTFGYPRIGKKREVKQALEAYWKGKVDAAHLLRVVDEVEESGWRAQLAAGVEHIGVGDATLYDHVLDWSVRLGLVPDRFRSLEGLERYFAMARGLPGVPALDLTKWFDTNYHYLVPEIDQAAEPSPDFAGFLGRVARAREILGSRAVPILLGPVTLLELARVSTSPEGALEAILRAYRPLLESLAAAGVDEVQLHEPALVLPQADTHRGWYERALERLAFPGLSINLVTYFDDLGTAYPWAVELPVQIISLDLTRGSNLELIRRHGWPQGKILGAGIIDARNVWRVRPEETLPVLEELRRTAPIRVGPSASLQFVPYSAATETGLAAELRQVLAFAEEKLEETRRLAEVLSGAAPRTALEPIEQAWRAYDAWNPAPPEVRRRVQGLGSRDFERPAPYAERRPRQIQLPAFPTTTIGSYPQTNEVRRLRQRLNRGQISPEEYRAGIDAWIGYTIGVQEALGLDVLVHGEFERTDMVEYFAQKLEGFAFTEHGWVQSYGSRYVRPPILYGDVHRPSPMTVREFQKAQSFTRRPVKGMLTGPVTILNWSYSRADLPRREIAFQLALALRDEIADLQAGGARVIQVDEPALREGLPLKPERWQEYLEWAVDAFRLATGSASPETQVHTHMCYAEFGDIYQAIDRLDADVILIENARSGDETLRDLAGYGYAREVGPGVYDVHSPVVVTGEQVAEKLRTFVRHLRPEQIWVNPDCGLKTRAWEEVLPSLRNIVQAARAMREEIRTPEARTVA